MSESVQNQIFRWAAVVRANNKPSPSGSNRFSFSNIANALITASPVGIGGKSFNFQRRFPTDRGYKGVGTHSQLTRLGSQSEGD